VYLASQSEDQADEMDFGLSAQPVLDPVPVSQPTHGRSFLFKGSKPCVDTTIEEHLGALFLAPEVVLDHWDLLSRYIKLHSRESYTYKCKGIPVVGSCSILSKDRKMKLRPIFNLAKLFQLALAPLQQALMEFVRCFPEYTLDQRDGHRWVTEELSTGSYLSSIDLITASDNVYLSQQVDMMTALFPHLGEEINLFKSVSRGFWRTPYSDILIKFDRGQPLGILVSFLSFSALILVRLRVLLFGSVMTAGRIQKRPRQFCLVGDDLVVSSQHGYRAIQALSELGGTVASHKSIMDSNVASFGGKLIDPLGSLEIYKLDFLDWKCPIFPVLRLGLSVVQQLGHVPRATRFFLQAPPPIGVGSNASVLDLVPFEVLETVLEEKLPVYPTRAPRNCHEEVFGSAFSLADMDIPKDHPLFAITQYEAPGTLLSGFWSPSIVDELRNESLNTIRDYDVRRSHAAVLSFLLHRKEHIALTVGNSDKSDKPPSKWRGKWSVWRKLQAYIPNSLLKLNLIGGVPLTTIIGSLALSVTASLITAVPTTHSILPVFTQDVSCTLNGETVRHIGERIYLRKFADTEIFILRKIRTSSSPHNMCEVEQHFIVQSASNDSEVALPLGTLVSCERSLGDRCVIVERQGR
jgi:hypothetical protein